MSDSYLTALTQELQAHGVDKWEVDDQGRHFKLLFRWEDKTLMHVFPRSGSDWRGVMNSLSALRKTMGVTRVIRKSENKTRRKPNGHAVCPPPLTITVRPDPFAVLANINKPPEVVRCPRMSLAEVAAMLRAA